MSIHYFKTLRTSETGKKFCKVQIEIDECFRVRKELLSEIDPDDNIDSFRSAFFVAGGGISSIKFKDTSKLDLNLWKQIRIGEYMPKRNNKVSKEIYLKMKDLPTVSFHLLNKCIGYGAVNFNNIGADFSDKDFIGFNFPEKYRIDISKFRKDCQEITLTEYNNLFNKNKTNDSTRSNQ